MGKLHRRRMERLGHVAVVAEKPAAPPEPVVEPEPVTEVEPLVEEPATGGLVTRVFSRKKAKKKSGKKKTKRSS